MWFVQGVGENDFQAAMDAVDAQYLNDIISSSNKNSDVATDVSVKDDGTTEEDVQVSTMLNVHRIRLFFCDVVCILYYGVCVCCLLYTSDAADD